MQKPLAPGRDTIGSRCRVVIEVPKEIQSSEARKKLESCLDPKLGNVRIRAIRKQGKNFVVEMHDEDDVTNLRLLRKFDEVGFTVDGEPNLNDPRIIIYDIDSGINEEELVIAVMLRNGYLKEGFSDEDFKKMFKPRFKLRKKEGETANWVVQLSLILFKKVTNQGRVYIGLRSCRIKEYHGITRCFKCQGLGHIGKYCRGAVTCFKCGEEGHHVSSCTKDRRECANCKRSGYKETGHSVSWNECPAVELFKRRREFSEHIEEYLTYLRKVKRKLKGEVVILSADANAKSELWGSPKEDSRGALLREVIEMDGWYIANDKRYGPTFDNGRPSSFIDITLTNRKVNTITVDWEVRGD
ncbi:hypothetical protein J437_LFUL012164 [Ladona fulva]|uniref:CCHC-type domain-containing protein n=1 Tax=Ladona fulva TaxID=123851 RepID=A0A8K0P504_LADFU|nr:hypothetical protein J437_LFUL012164 [Ladona fulva]